MFIDGLGRLEINKCYRFQIDKINIQAIAADKVSKQFLRV